MLSIGAYEAKTHFSQLLERVAAGERILIMKHDVPVAILQPAERAKELSVEEAISQLEQFRIGKLLNGLTIREMIGEGRR